MSYPLVRRLALPVAALLTAVLLAPSASAQQTPPPKPAEAHGAHHAAGAKEEDHEKSGWKELDAFHDVMAASWHPARKDSLGPARASAPRLVAAAKAWSVVAAPKGCDAPEIKAAIARLVPESEAVAGLVTKQADDATVKAALKTVHDTFHVVEDKCKPEKPAGHGSHH